MRSFTGFSTKYRSVYWLATARLGCGPYPTSHHHLTIRHITFDHCTVTDPCTSTDGYAQINRGTHSDEHAFPHNHRSRENRTRSDIRKTINDTVMRDDRSSVKDYSWAQLCGAVPPQCVAAAEAETEQGEAAEANGEQQEE